MNINNYQSINFCGSKTKVVKSLKNANSRKTTTLYDVIKSKINTRNNKIDDNFVFTYDKLDKECEALNKKYNFDKLVKQFRAEIHNRLKQMEIERKTCYKFFEEKLKWEKGVYKQIIARCFNDLDEAILANAPQKQIDKLTSTLDMFIIKYGHYDR